MINLVKCYLRYTYLNLFPSDFMYQAFDFLFSEAFTTSFMSIAFSNFSFFRMDFFPLQVKSF